MKSSTDASSSLRKFRQPPSSLKGMFSMKFWLDRKTITGSLLTILCVLEQVMHFIVDVSNETLTDLTHMGPASGRSCGRFFQFFPLLRGSRRAWFVRAGTDRLLQRIHPGRDLSGWHLPGCPALVGKRAQDRPSTPVCALAHGLGTAPSSWAVRRTGRLTRLNVLRIFVCVCADCEETAEGIVEAMRAVRRANIDRHDWQRDRGSVLDNHMHFRVGIWVRVQEP